MNLTKTVMLAALLGGLAVVSGCNKDEPVAAYSVPKEPAKPVQSAAAGPRQGGAVPQWTVPDGWKEVPASGMRFAAFALTEDEPPVTLTVIPLPSSPLLANVNRWEGELGLPPSDDAGLDKVVQHIDSDGGAHVDLVDLTGPESADKPRQRMLAALIENQGRTWFFKAVGPAETMGAQRDNFEKFLRSVKFGDAPAVAEAPAAAVAAAPKVQAPQQQQSQQTAKTGLTAWTKPESWKQDEKPRAMRELTFFAGDEAPAEVIVSRMGGNFGGLLANINRWRQQVGLGPVDSEKDQPSTRMQLDNGAAAVFDMSGTGANGKRQIVVMTARNDGVWFFKILGPSGTVEKQKPAFDEFLKSVKFAAPAMGEK